MTDASAIPADEPTPTPVPASVTANPALIDWPSDIWGMTSTLRAAFIMAARAVRGNDEKMKLFMDTVRIGAQHAVARFDGDKAGIQDEIFREAEAIERRAFTARVAGVGLPR